MLAARGATVVVADIDAAAAEQTVALLGASARRARSSADVSDPASVEQMVAFSVDRFGGLDIACNVAGVSGEPKPFVEHSLAEWQRVIDVDLTGVFLCMQHELRRMVAAGRGAIVNVSSGAGVVAAPGQPQYTAAKHGVLGLTKQAAQEYAVLGHPGERGVAGSDRDRADARLPRRATRSRRAHAAGPARWDAWRRRPRSRSRSCGSARMPRRT